MIVLMILTALVGSAVCRPPVERDEDCRGIRDGTVVAWGCRSYTVCRNQRPFEVDCSGVGLVYNPIKKQCDNKLNTPAPCGLYRDCRGKADARYADKFTNCTAYYTCQGGRFFGHNQCNPGLVFHEQIQICDWPYNVAPPCGTKGGKPSPNKAPRTVRKNRRLRKVKVAMTSEEKDVRTPYWAKPHDVRPRDVLSRGQPRDVLSRGRKRQAMGRSEEKRYAGNRAIAKRPRKAEARAALDMVYKEFVHGF